MKKIFTKRVLSIVLCITMILSCIPIVSMTAFGATGYVYKGGAGEKLSDLDTSSKYSESLGDNASTEYAGRVWTDKSVYTDDATFNVFGGGTTTIKLNEEQNGEDFLVAYSALASAQSISGQTQAPVDVVLIIDISGSMSNNESNMDNNKSRIYNTVQAANNAIEKIMSINENNRVAVVAFSSTGEVLLPLDSYTKLTTTEREWVSTGFFGGYWEEYDVVNPYFSLNRDTGSNNYAILYTKAVNSSNEEIEKRTNVEGGTNIQVGLYEGMKLLTEEEDTTVEINGESIQRVPSVIILSDGSPTYSSSSNSWWAPSANNNNGPGNNAYAGNGMKTILVGAYMKDAIDRNYGIEDTSYSTTVYSIGMGISDLSDDEKDLAYMTLDPGSLWNNNDVKNSMKTAIKNYWNSYIGSNSVSINVGKYENGNYRDSYYNLTHPTTGYDVDFTNGYDYVDDYYDADNASAVTSVFEEIVSSIAISAPQVPTEIKSTDGPTTGGKIIYTDPIGEYMEVKNVKAIIYAGQTFTARTVTVSGNETFYTFQGEVHSPIYGDQQISDIIITVTDDDGKQTIKIEIPASVIPLRVNEVTLNSDGTVKTHVNNGALPARVIYSVGLQSNILKEADDGTVYVNRSKLSAEYLRANTNADGTINFYSNLYTNMHRINGYTVGDTVVEFEPSHSNDFYYILEDMPIYKDTKFTQKLTAAEGIDDDAVYYYLDEYYHGSSVEIDAIERTGAQLKQTELKTVTVDGVDYLYRAEGSPRLNRILRFEGTKAYNRTNTAEDFYAPEFHYAEGSTDAYDGKFIVHQGNNGLITLVAGGDIKITKSVNAGIGVTAPDMAFEFSVDLDGAEVNDGTYDYVVVDKDGNEVKTGVLSKTNYVLTLKDGQTATVFSLPPGTTYEITEAPLAGFTTQAEGTTGTVEVGKTSVVSFVNTYNVTPVTFPTSGTLQGTKVLEGRSWAAGDSFRFFILPYNNAPLPSGFDAVNGITVTDPDTAGGNTATFDFGHIEFTAPGVYRYTIYEAEPDANDYLPGMSYSRALYRLVVNVVDSGNGTLSVENYEIQRLYDDNANRLFHYDANNQIVMNNGEEAQDTVRFVNTYVADAVVRVPVALKDYTDNSGRKPLVSGMFEFELEAVGIVENGQVVAGTQSSVPMPFDDVDVDGVDDNGRNLSKATNEGHNITFNSITYYQSDIPAGQDSVIFRYAMTEIIPDGHVNNVKDGMKYHSDTIYIDVEVAIDPLSYELSASPAFGGTRIPTFTNVYTPESVKTDILGNKTLNGRDMTEGEVFEFVLSSNPSTGNAIRDGIVIVPESTATVENALNGVKKAFSFKDIEFKKAGTYVFTVSETQGNSASVKYDNSLIAVAVVIDDTNDDGKLEVVSVTYSNGASSADFVNTYSSTFSDTPVSLTGTKSLTGKTLLAGEFYFSVKEYYEGALVGNRFVTHTGSTTLNGNAYEGRIVILDNVTYDKAGTYEYYINEQIPQNKVGGTTYDTSVFRYTVVVTDDLNGNLKVASQTLEKADGSNWAAANAVVFENIYEPTDAEATLPIINKVVVGDRSEALKQGEFDFVLEVVSASPQNGVILPQTTTVSNAANGNIIFDKITFTEAGTYVLSVREIVPSDQDKVPGITYSAQEITAVYEVIDDRNGTLTAVLTYFMGGNVIRNLYTATPETVTIEIDKNFTGRNNDEWLATDFFDFEIKVEDADTLSAIASGKLEFAFDDGSTDTKTVTIASKGDKARATVKVNNPGTYKFKVSEVRGNIKGVEYDNTVKDIIIVATDDSANARILVTVNDISTNTASVEFVNKYKTEATDEISITASKKVTPSAGNSYTMVGGEFSFVITGTQGAPMPQNTTVTNDASGKVDFGEIKFNERGIYAYTIAEAQNVPAGFTYDDEVYTLTVTVTDDYASGKLVATTKITDKSGRDAQMVFDNSYDPDETSISLFGKKTLDGNHKSLEADEFEFTIKALTQNAPMPQVTTVKNTVTGLFNFDAITYTSVGVFEYEITEKDLGKKGYTYDDTVYTVTVSVTDENGQLKATASGLGEINNPTVKFTNKYEPKPVDLTLGASGEFTKTISGRGLKTQEFIFALLDGDKEIATAKNTETGMFEFKLTFKKAGTYNYTLVEKDNGVAGVTYDKKTYGVEIKVDDVDGELQVGNVKYTSDDQPVTSIQFNNVYKPDDTDVTINALKKLTGRELKDGEFKFVLKDKDGKVVATASNLKDGKIAFDKIVIKTPGIHTYTVYEEIGTLENVTYDKTEFVVEISVSDNDGKLEASTPVIKKGDTTVTEIVFENVYKVPEPQKPHIPNTGDSANILWLALLAFSGLGLVAVTVSDRKKINR